MNERHFRDFRTYIHIQYSFLIISSQKKGLSMYLDGTELLCFFLWYTKDCSSCIIFQAVMPLARCRCAKLSNSPSANLNDSCCCCWFTLSTQFGLGTTTKIEAFLHFLSSFSFREWGAFFDGLSSDGLDLGWILKIVLFFFGSGPEKKNSHTPESFSYFVFRVHTSINCCLYIKSREIFNVFTFFWVWISGTLGSRLPVLHA